MIATVRIAPIEHWCEPAKEWLEHPEIIGRALVIETSGVDSSDDCDGKLWIVPHKGNEWLYELVPLEAETENRVCSHMLEMD